MIAIPLKQWLKWSVEERAQMETYWESKGQKWYIDSTGVNLENVQKDYQDEADAQGVTVAKLVR